MKYVALMVFFLSIASTAQDLNNIRSEYPKAVQSAENAAKLDAELAKINSSGKSELIAYNGAISTVKAKFAKKKSEKKDFFKAGVSLIESAVKADPSNIEIRYIRMGVQENSPRFLGYHKNIEADKYFILKNFGTISSKELKALIKDFVQKSKNFSESEKANLGKT